MNASAEPIQLIKSGYRAPWKERFRVWRTNGKNRRVAKAVATLSKALQDDPGFAQVWHANIAMPIYDASKSMDVGWPIPITRCNLFADRLMKHLFNVEMPKR